MKSQTAVTLEPNTKPTPMKAIAVRPGMAGGVYLAELDRPTLDEIPNGRGVLVKVLRVGVDGTDKEINAAEYGAAPPGYDFLVLGHESFGRVEAVGSNVSELQPGDYVVATVRRPGTSIYDRIGTNDMTTDDVYYERGINLRHGYLTEYYVDDAEFIVKVPEGLKEVGVLLEPTTVVEKGITQAYEIQRRMRVWKPARRRDGRRHDRAAGDIDPQAARLGSDDVCAGEKAHAQFTPDRSHRSTVRIHSGNQHSRRSCPIWTIRSGV